MLAQIQNPARDLAKLLDLVFVSHTRLSKSGHARVAQGGRFDHPRRQSRAGALSKPHAKIKQRFLPKL